MERQEMPGWQRSRGMHVGRRTGLLTVLLLAGAGLQACGRGADSGATASPVAPGRPGTGDPVVIAPSRAGSITESPGIGGSRGLIPDGATGKTVLGQQPQRTGVGLDGGLGQTLGAQAPAPADTPAAERALAPSSSAR